MNAANTMLLGTRATVIGYGPCGKGVDAAAAGARVSLADTATPATAVQTSVATEWVRARVVGPTTADQVGERADLDVGFERVTESLGAVQGVAVAASDFGGDHQSGLDEVVDDHLYGTFGDANLSRDVSHPHFGVKYQADQDVAMVGQQRPMRCPRSMRLGSWVVGHPPTPFFTSRRGLTFYAKCVSLIASRRRGVSRAPRRQYDSVIGVRRGGPATRVGRDLWRERPGGFVTATTLLDRPIDLATRPAIRTHRAHKLILPPHLRNDDGPEPTA